MRKISLAALALSCAFNLAAQNSLWVCAPKKIQGTSSVSDLPTGPSSNNPYDPYDYYDGWSAKHGSNGILDVNGNLHFFIVDGAIYNSTGAYVAYAWGAANPPTMSVGNVTQPKGDGGSEQIIIPHPVNCNQYYIFGILTENNIENGVKTGEAATSSVPAYCLYDAANQSVISRGLWFSPNPNTVTTGLTSPIFTPFSTSNPSNTNGDSQVTASMWAAEANYGIAAIAASDLQSDGSRFVGCKMDDNVYFIKIESTGNLRYWKRINHSNFPAGSNSRAEFELVYDPVVSRFKMAFESQMEVTDPSGAVQQNYCIKYFELSSNLLTVLSSSTAVMPFHLVQGTTYTSKPISGIEFSPNEQKLYVSASTTVAGSSPSVYTIDLVNSPTVLTSLGLSASYNSILKNSSIEKDAAGNLWFSSATGLYRLTSANTPNPANMSGSAILAFSYIRNFALNVDLANISPVDGEYLNTFSLPGQVDDMSYTSYFSIITECCKASTIYDKNSYTNITSGTWTMGLSNNPIQTNSASTFVTIRDELRIKKGTTVTINNMTIKFAPNARLVVEAGDATTNGGKLIINNSTLTVDLSCGADLLWNGVQVQGINTENQGSFSGNSKQGRLSMLNCTVEHARRAVSNNLYTPTSQNQILNFGTGGAILLLENCTFKNNERGVVMANYYAPNNASDLSLIKNNLFTTTSLIKEVDIPIAHVQLSRVKGIRVQGNDFNNTTPSSFTLAQRGTGILSGRSSFFATAICSNNQCTSFDPNNFENLYNGIYTSSSNGTLTFTTDRSYFKNNSIGVRSDATVLPRITRNTFDVLQISNTQTIGLYLNGSNKYKVEENLFKVINPSFGTDLSYGIVVRSSGVEPNEIYKNTFTDLMIGGQVEGVNRATDNQTGLVWKCNLFRVRTNDITNINGTMSGNQGYFDNTSLNNAQQKAANNTFSQASEAMSLEHDFKLVNSANFKYVHTSEALMTPDSYTTPNLVLPIQALVGTTPVSYSATVGCPSKLKLTVVVLQNSETAAQNKINSDLQMIDGGNTASLTNDVTTLSLSAAKTAILNYSPYVSDPVLTIYLNRNPSESDIKEVIVANSPITPEIMQIVISKNLSSTTMTTINSAQGGISKRLMVYDDIRFNKEELYFAINEQLSYYLLDTVIDPADTTTGPSDTSFVNKLNSRNEDFYKYLRINHAIQTGNLTQAQSLLSGIIGYGRNKDLCDVQIQTYGQTNLIDFYTNNTNVWNLGVSVMQDPNAYECSVQAKYLLFDDMNSSAPYKVEIAGGSKSTNSNDGLSSKYETSTEHSFELYPNPTENKLTIKQLDEQSSAIVRIYDLNGSIVLEENLTDVIQQFDLSTLYQGMYIVQITDLNSGKAEVHKLIKK